MKLCLDLFCGTKSWSKAFSAKGYVCLSLDFDPKFAPTWCADIFEWVPPIGLHKNVDVICLGTPCTNVSTANKAKTEAKFRETEALWARAFALCDLLLKDTGVILAENPSRCESSGCRSRPIGMVDAIRPGLWRCEVNYCRYSTPQQVFSWKRTTIWCSTDLSNRFQPKVCDKNGRCDVGNVDPETGAYKHYVRMAFCPEARNRTKQRSDTNRRGEWAAMPEQLCRELADAVAIRDRESVRPPH